MSNVSVDPDELERQLDEIILQYQQAAATGAVSGQREFLARYPGHAEFLQFLLTAPGSSSATMGSSSPVCRAFQQDK
jgi:hypothetical protein